MPTDHKLPVVVLLSGSGSNLQAIMDAAQSGKVPIEIRAVISNRPNAYGLERARQAGIDAVALDHKNFTTREAFDQALMKEIDHYDPGLLIMAGYMRILTPLFVEHYAGHMLNIHPSLLPRYPGLKTHHRALENGDAEHGASVHFVTTELDGGPVVLQVSVPICSDDTPESLASRVLEQEHRIFPMAIDWFARGRLKLKNEQAELDGTPLQRPCQLNAETGEVENCPES
jgi:phosphoribosylglycinamide formyltransferase-1